MTPYKLNSRRFFIKPDEQYPDSDAQNWLMHGEYTIGKIYLSSHVAEEIADGLNQAFTPPPKKIVGICPVCVASNQELKYLPLAVWGSEGVLCCPVCELAIIDLIKERANLLGLLLLRAALEGEL